MSDLARRLVEHPRWPNPWPKPMVDSEGLFVTSMRSHGAVPDLNHPATKGWLLAMLREATGDELAYVCPPVHPPGDWFVCVDNEPVRGSSGTTEGEALAAALLAVWGEAP